MKIVSRTARLKPIRLYLNKEILKEIKRIQNILLKTKQEINITECLIEAIIPFGSFETTDKYAKEDGLDLIISPNGWRIVDYSFDSDWRIADSNGKAQKSEQIEIGCILSGENKLVSVTEEQEIESFLMEDEKLLCLRLYYNFVGK